VTQTAALLDVLRVTFSKGVSIGSFNKISSDIKRSYNESTVSKNRRSTAAQMTPEVSSSCYVVLVVGSINTV
jgi:hypothetical protein